MRCEFGALFSSSSAALAWCAKTGWLQEQPAFTFASMTSPSQSFPMSLPAFGFALGKTSGHMARSMMLSEMLCFLQHPGVKEPKEVKKLIVEENLLGKPTFSSRVKSFHHLVQLYGLDASLPLFRVFQQFSALDPSSVPLMAATCVFCRDPQFRHSFSLIEALRVGETLPRERMEMHLEEAFPSRFSTAMKKSLAQNVNTSWTVCGHLAGRRKKTRTEPNPSLLATTYAMFAGFLAGFRGEILVHSVFGRLAGVAPQQVISHLKDASRHGWVLLKHSGGVTEIDFSPLLSEQELSLLHGAA